MRNKTQFALGVVCTICLFALVFVIANISGYRLVIDPPASTPADIAAVATDVDPQQTHSVSETPVMLSTLTPEIVLVDPDCNAAETRKGGAFLYESPTNIATNIALPADTQLCLQVYQKDTFWVYVSARLPNDNVKSGWIYAPFISVFPQKVSEFTESWATDAGLTMWEGALPTVAVPATFTATSTPMPAVKICVEMRAKRLGAFVYSTSDDSTQIGTLDSGDVVCAQAYTRNWVFITYWDGNADLNQGWVYVPKLENFPDNATNLAVEWYKPYNIPPYDSQHRPAEIAPPVPTAIPTATATFTPAP